MRIQGIAAARTAAILAATLLGLVAFTPAPADATPSDRLTTLRGTVTAMDGRPVAGVEVTAGLYEGPVKDRNAIKTVTTSSTGRYSVRVTAGSALSMKFVDPTGRFFDASKATFAAAAGTTHRVDRVLVRVSRITGVVRDTSGRPLRHAAVRAYDASDGTATSFSALTDRNGVYRLLVRAGRYKVRFAHDGVRAEWFGEAATRKASPTVAVDSGAKRVSIDAVLG